MQRVSSALVILLGLASCSPVAKESSPKTAEPARTVYVSITQKGQVRNFLNRLAGPASHLVVTEAPVPGALQSERLILTGYERLMVVELQQETARALPGERFRMGGFAVVEVPVGKDPHTLFGSHTMYAEDIGEREIVLPAESTVRDANLLKPVTSALEAGVSVDIDQAFLEARLKELSGAVPVTIAGATVTISERRSATGRANARAYLKQEYERLGFTASEHQYGSGANPGINFVAEKAGSEPGKVVIISSHLDSVGNSGADDDGAGTISALAIAQALKDAPLRYTLRVVAFDEEESGLVGSAAYARSLNTAGTISDVIGVFNLEMTGYDADDDGAFHAIDCDENTSADLSALITDVVARDPLRLQVVAACTNRSDHASFWRYDVPAIVVSQNFFGGDSNPCYHASCDKVDRMHFPYMTRVTTAVGRAIAGFVVDAR